MANNKIKIAITPNSPFIIESHEKYSGFEIDLWETIAKEEKIDFEYKKYDFPEIIPAIVKGKADIALGAITINKEREKNVDFSHPIFDSGLQILLSKNRSKINIANTIKTFFRQGYKELTKPFVILLLIIFAFGNVMWFIERSRGSLSLNYFPGVFQATWFSLCAIIGSPTVGDLYYYTISSWSGRLIIILEQLASLIILGLLIGQFTSFITTRKIRLIIENQNDLRGKRVATVKSTTSEDVLKKIGAVIISVIKIEDAYEKLRKNDVEAVVFDSPILIYYVLNDKTKWAEVVGTLFDKQHYGIAMSQGNNQLREKINRAILTIKENGYYNELYRKWFGQEE